MTLRRITSVLFASVLLAGSLAAGAEAATARSHGRPMVRHTAMHSRRMPVNRGGDAQNGAVDQLNAQSLARAQTNPPTQ